MKKIFIILMLVMVAISVIPEASYAHGYDRGWRRHHQQVWRVHERQWRFYEREWAAHRGDRRWRKRHISMWPEWYRWHRENESYLNFRMSTGYHDGSNLEIDFGFIR